MAFDDSGSDEELFYSAEEQLEQLGKGTRQLWQPWRRDIWRYDVRPYRCLHIGDTIEAPVFSCHRLLTRMQDAPDPFITAFLLGQPWRWAESQRQLLTPRKIDLSLSLALSPISLWCQLLDTSLAS